MKDSDPNNVEFVSGHFTVTYSGYKFRLDKPNSNCYTIEDIATALSKLCRFNGHTYTFYSVAEHCYHMSYMVPREFALDALMHDATEAYIGDYPKPMKLAIPLIGEIEDSIMQSIAEKFGLTYPLPPEVKEADKRMIPTEAPQLLDYYDRQEWNMADIHPYAIILPCWPWREAKLKFLERYSELTGDYQEVA